MTTKTATFISACKDYFGLHDGETTMQFAAEIKALTDKDRAEIKEGLAKLGYEITPPTVN